MRDGRLYGAGFNFDGKKVGVFYEGEEPSCDGDVEYMPVLSPAHLKMHRAVSASGVARCTYKAADGRKLSFDVVAAPGYGLLTVANFSVQ